MRCWDHPENLAFYLVFSGEFLVLTIMGNTDYQTEGELLQVNQSSGSPAFGYSCPATAIPAGYYGGEQGDMQNGGNGVFPLPDP